MRVLLVVTVLALVALATAEPGVLDAIKKTAQDTKTLVKGSRSTPPKVLSSSKRSSNSSSSSSSAAKVDPKLMAKEIIAVFGDADGSAYFKGNKILPHTVAEVPPRKKGHRAHSSHHSRSRSSSSSEKHRFREPIASPVKKTAIPPPPPAPPGKRPVSSRSSSHSRSVAENPRHRRPLFNFNSVPAGVTGVGLRKHHFGKKHHTLLVRFANAHAKVTTVIVVDKFVGPAGRPSKKRGDDRRRGKKQSDLEIKNLKHPNLFVFNEHGEQVFPKKKGSQSSKSSQRRKHSSSGSSKHKKETLMDKMKKKLAPPKKN